MRSSRRSPPWSGGREHAAPDRGVHGSDRARWAAQKCRATKASLRTVADLVPMLTGNERRSMRAMIAGLQRLPAIELTAVIEEGSGQAPFNPDIRAQPSGGAVLETVVNYFRSGLPV